MDKTVLITGGETGIGKHTAFKFAENGYNVIITYVNDKLAADKVIKQCLENGAGLANFYYLNLKDNKSISEFINNVKNDFKTIDIFINNAGFTRWKYLDELSMEEIEDILRINLEGLIKLTKHIMPIINEQIINIASGASKTPHETLTVYCASKFGVRGFTQALALEIKDKKIYNINPNMTATPMTDFKGRAPEEIALIIYSTVTEKIPVEHGGEVDAWEF